MADRLQLMRVDVERLFGVFDHTVHLRTADRITILHGPNGVGKTVILRLIHAFFEGRYDSLIDTNFQKLSLELTDGRCVVIGRSRSIGESTKQQAEGLVFSLAGQEFPWQQDRSQHRKMISFIDDEVPYITRIGEEQWSDDRTGELYNSAQLVSVFSHMLPERLRRSVADDPDWLVAFRKSIQVHLVETQRLLLPETAVRYSHLRRHQLSGRKAFASTVKKYSTDLRNRAANALGKYAEHSQSLDRSFPQRLLGDARTEVLETGDLKDRMNQLEQRRVKLKQIGLIEGDASYPFDIDTLDSASGTQKTVMTLYVEDTESKLSVLDDLKGKVDLLLSNMNRKFTPNKQLRTDRSTGFLVTDKRGLRIDLDSLSSGEQHELVLVYDLLFQVPPHALVLIDEPELSLHVTWQKAFLSDLLAIIGAVDFDVLLATHSPFIVGDRVDLMVPLALDPTEHPTLAAAV